MKVLFTFGGLPHYYNSILNKLNNVANLEIHVLVPYKSQDTLGKGVFQSQEGITFKVHYLKEYTTYYRKPFFKEFLKLLSTEKPDIIVTCWPYSLAFILKPSLLFKIKFRKIKLILKDIPFQLPKYREVFSYYRTNKVITEEGKVIEHNTINIVKLFFLTVVRKLLFDTVNAHVDYIEYAFEILGSYGVNKEKIFVIYNSPDTDELLKKKKEIQSLSPILPQNNYRLIHVGRLVKWKKVDLLIKAFAKIKLKYSEAELIIIGEGPEEMALKKLAIELNISESIKFIGGVYKSITLGQYLSASSIYVLAGMGGLSINEAMCFDKPIICSVCDGTEKKLVKEDYNGKYFKEDSIVDLSEKIDQLFANLVLLREMGKNSGEIISRDININVVIKGYLNAFNYVMKV